MRERSSASLQQVGLSRDKPRHCTYCLYIDSLANTVEVAKTAEQYNTRNNRNKHKHPIIFMIVPIAHINTVLLY